VIAVKHLSKGLRRQVKLKGAVTPPSLQWVHAHVLVHPKLIGEQEKGFVNMACMNSCRHSKQHPCFCEGAGQRRANRLYAVKVKVNTDLLCTEGFIQTSYDTSTCSHTNAFHSKKPKDYSLSMTFSFQGIDLHNRFRLNQVTSGAEKVICKSGTTHVVG